MSSTDRAADVEWELWYEDLFDRETPRQVEMRGRGLLEGIIQLWIRHLTETVRKDGNKGFSRFNLWLRKERQSVEVVGDWEAQVRLREWIYGDAREMDEQGKELLDRIAEAHQNQILRNESSRAILRLARSAQDREDFNWQLLPLIW